MSIVVTSFEMTDGHDLAVQYIDDPELGQLEAWIPICNRKVVDNIAEFLLATGTDDFTIQWDRFRSGVYPIGTLGVTVRYLWSQSEYIENIDLANFEYLESSDRAAYKIGTACYTIPCELQDTDCYTGVDIT